VLLALALAGCSTDDGSDGGPDSPSTAASSPDGTATASSSAGESGSVAPATGKEMSDKYVSFRLPADEDWEVDGGGTVGFLAPPDDRVSQINIGGAGATIDDLDEAARLGLKSMRDVRPTAEQEDNRTVGGLEGVVLAADDDHGYYYQFVTLSAGTHVAIVFDLPRNDAAAHELIDAVLASVEWK
jgi:hypothetical protein